MGFLQEFRLHIKHRSTTKKSFFIFYFFNLCRKEKANGIALNNVRHGNYMLRAKLIQCQPFGSQLPHILNNPQIPTHTTTSTYFSFSICIVESDATNVVKAIYNVSLLALEISLINFIRPFCLQRPGILIQHCSLTANKVAHDLASQGLHREYNLGCVVFCRVDMGTFVDHDMP